MTTASSSYFAHGCSRSRSPSDVSEEARHCTDAAGAGKNGPSGHRIPP